MTSQRSLRACHPNWPYGLGLHCLTVGALVAASFAVAFVLAPDAAAQIPKNVTISFPAAEPTEDSPAAEQGERVVEVHVVSRSDQATDRAISAAYRVGEHIRLFTVDSDGPQVEFAAPTGLAGPDGFYHTTITNAPPPGTEIAATACEPLPPGLFDPLGFRSCQYQENSLPTPIPGGGAVHGEVFDPDETGGFPYDAGIESATVMVATADGEPVEETDTDGQGEYRVDALLPGDYTVTADAKGYQSATKQTTVESGERTTVDFGLEQAGVLRGEVTDTEDVALEGVEVTATDEAGDTAGIDTSAEDGSYRIDDLDGGDYTVTADADGYRPASLPRSVQPGQTQEANFALTAVESLEITPEQADMVKGDQRQFAAEVSYSDGSTEEVTGDAEWSSSDGAVATVNDAGVVTGQGQGAADISASYDGASDAVALTVTHPPGGIAGTVSDADAGQALAGAVVTATADGGTQPAGTTETDSSGGYEIAGLDPGAYTVTADHDDYQAESKEESVNAGATTNPVDFALEPMAEEGADDGESEDGTGDHEDSEGGTGGDGTSDDQGAGDEDDPADDEEDAGDEDGEDDEGTADDASPGNDSASDEGTEGASESAAAQACPEGRVPGGGFTDVDAGNVHAAAVDCVAWYGITQGTSATSYTPAGVTTRGQMAAFIARTMEIGGVDLGDPGDQGFADVDGHPLRRRINQLAAAGVVQGTSETTYHPQAPVTRAQMASFLVRAYETTTDTVLPAGKPGFTDTRGSVHAANIAKAAEAGWTKGVTAEHYEPASSVRRDQQASFLARLLDDFVRDGLAAPPDAAASNR